MSDLINAFQDGTTFGATALGVDKFLICQKGGGYAGKSAPSGLVSYPWSTGQGVVNDQLLGGALTSAPAVAGDRLAVRGNNGNIWYKSPVESGGDWSELPGGIVSSAPAICMEAGGTVHVFARGMEFQLWHSYKAPKQNWTPWSRQGIPELPGGMKSAPSVASLRAGRLDVVAQGSNNEVWHLVYENGWQSWSSIGGIVTSRPTCCWWDNSTFHVFVRGQDNNVWHRYFDWSDGQGKWHNWMNDVPVHPKGGISSSPICVVDVSGRVDLFARAAGAEIWNTRWTSSTGWKPWKDILINSVTYPA
jgi:hypothetical protein